MAGSPLAEIAQEVDLMPARRWKNLASTLAYVEARHGRKPTRDESRPADDENSRALRMTRSQLRNALVD